MPQNFHRPDINYIAVSRQNDQRYQVLTRNKKRPPTDFLIDLDYNYLIDTVNNLDVRIDGISLGDLPGVNDPTNFGKLLTPDGSGSSSWVFVQANNVLDASLTGSKLSPQTITARELADGGIPDTKIAPNAITTIKVLDQNITSAKIADLAIVTSKLADGAVTYDKMADNAINTEIILNNAVTTPKIADANVTLAKLAQDVLDRLVPIGTIIEFSGNAGIPAIWLECNGQPVSRATYATLFANIGTIYGVGDGATTFNLPDRRGRVAVGIGSDNSTGGRITAATASSVNLAGTFGAETQTLDITQIPPHHHSVGKRQDAQSGTSFTGYTEIGLSDIVSGDTGGGLPHPNVQPSIFQRFYIRAL